jgi:hypothetical protein
VRVVRRTPDKQDPFSRFGAGFYIAVYNKGDAEVVFGPTSLEVLSAKGQHYEVLTIETLQARQKAAASRARAVGMFAGLAMGAMSTYGAAQGVSSSITSQAMNTGLMAATVGDNTANRITSESAAIDADYRTNDLAAGPLASLQGRDGRVIIDRINDRTPVIFVIHIGEETHRIAFGSLK